MSRRSRAVERPSAHTEPDWPTTVRGILSGGRVHGTDGSLWLYYTVPLGIVEDAKSVTESLLPGHPLRNAFDQLGAMATPRFNRRQSAKSTYRRVRLLLVNLPGIYQSSNSGALGTFQNTAFAGEPVPRRILVLGVRLAPRMGSGGFRSAVDSMVTFMAAQGIPLSDFDEDFARVSQTLSRCGLSVPTDDEMDVLASWWSTRRNRATPMLSHPAHLHVFDDVHSTEAAARIGVSDCTGWTDLPGQYQLTVASVSQLLLGLRSADDPWTRWVDHLRRENLLALSIQGLVEPAKVTAAELRRVRKQYNADVSERFNQNKLNRGDQDEMLHELTEFEQAYQTGGPPTLIDGSVLVALNGGRHDLSRRATMQPYELAEMAYRQTVGLAEMWLASPVLANPHLHDMPAPAIAYSGIAGLSRVGDADGAQVGLTVTDRQPSYLSRTAASRGDRATCMLVVGQTGSGKSFVLQWLACQFAKERDDDGRPPPQLVFDPKLGSDFSEMVRAAGGRVVSLDDLISTDGVLDPMRSDEPERHIDEAAEMIMFVNPWGSRADDSYTALLKALKVGATAGARCTGQALRLALDRGAPAEVIQPVFDLAESSPLFRSCIGFDPDAPGLGTFDGLTYIKVGRSALSLPSEQKNPADYTAPERATVNLIRRVTLGSVRAMAGRGGVLHLDEAWTVLTTGSGITEVGKTARSLDVLVVLYTQKGMEGENVGVDSYVSRVLLLPMNTERDARQGLSMMGVEPTARRLEALTEGPELADGKPNWASNRALIDPVTKQVLRGTIGIYFDLRERAVEVEIKVPPAQAKLFSTTPVGRAAAPTRGVPDRVG